MSEHDAHAALSATAKLRALPARNPEFENTMRMRGAERNQRKQQALWLYAVGLSVDAHASAGRERRKPATVSVRRPGATPGEQARQAVVDFINQQAQPT